MEKKRVKKREKKWFLAFLLLQLTVLFLLAGVMFVMDPFFHYHKPIPGISYRLYEERYINNGITKNFTYDSIITGTSMTQNFKSSEWDELMGTNSVKLPFAGAGYRELADNLRVAFESGNQIKNVLWCIDYNGLRKEPDWKAYNDYPEYLYDDNIFNDVYYLFNKEILYQGVANNLIMTRHKWPGTTFDAYSAWERPAGLEEILKVYSPSSEVEPMEEGLTEEERALVEENIRTNLVSVIEENPDTDFYLFYPPYSPIYWDSIYREGETRKQIEAEALATDILLQYPNALLFCFYEFTDITDNYDYYTDELHYTSLINSWIMHCMKGNLGRLTRENRDAHMQWTSDHFLNYNYDGIFVADHENRPPA